MPQLSLQIDAISDWLNRQYVDPPTEYRSLILRTANNPFLVRFSSAIQLIDTLKVQFRLSQTRRKPYKLWLILKCTFQSIPNETLTNEKTNEQLKVKSGLFTGGYTDISVIRCPKPKARCLKNTCCLNWQKINTTQTEHLKMYIRSLPI